MLESNGMASTAATPAERSDNLSIFSTEIAFYYLYRVETLEFDLLSEKRRESQFGVCSLMRTHFLGNRNCNCARICHCGPTSSGAMTL